MQTFATLTVQRNVAVAKDIINELIHSWFLKFAASTGLTTKLCRSFDLVCQKITNICHRTKEKRIKGPKICNGEKSHTDTSVFSADKAFWYTFALDMITRVNGRIRVVSGFDGRGALV